MCLVLKKQLNLPYQEAIYHAIRFETSRFAMSGVLVTWGGPSERCARFLRKHEGLPKVMRITFFSVLEVF